MFVVSLAACAVPNAPGVYADLRKVLDWINAITGGCNAETCLAGDCMTKEKLDRDALHRFDAGTPNKLL